MRAGAATPPGARPGSAAPLAAGTLLLVACLGVVYRGEIADGGARLTSDLIDGRIADALQLHWFNVFAGREPWRRPPFFHPAADTLGYNDGYFLFGVFFSLFHAVGADVFLSAELASVPFRIAGFAALALLAREALALPWPFALLAAAIGTLSNAVHLQQVHVQLLTVYLAPGLALLLWRAFGRAAAGRRSAATAYASAAALGIAAWALTAFYMLWFTALFALAGGAVACLRRPRAIPAALRLATAAPFRGPVALLAIGLVPFALVYAPTRANTCGHSWNETSGYTLDAADLVHVGPGNLVATHLGFGSEAFSEHAVGLPPLLWLLTAIGAALGFAPGRRAIHLPLAGGFLLTLALALRWGDHTAWRLLYLFAPGASAVRVVCRVMLLLALVAALLAADALATLHRAWRLPPALTAALALLLLVEEVNTASVASLPRREEDALFARVQPPPPGCTAFVVAGRRRIATVQPGLPEDDFLASVDAMMLSELDRLPTPQGLASFTPPGFDPFARLNEAVLLGGGGRPVCGVDLVTGHWRPVAPDLVAFAPGTAVSFADGGRRSDDLVAGGWDPAEAGGRWSDGPRAALVLRRSGTGPLQLVLRARVGFGVRAHPERVDIFANGTAVATWPNDPAMTDHALLVPAAAIGSDGIVRLEFRLRGLRSPADAGPSIDTRRLGVFLTTVAAR